MMAKLEWNGSLYLNSDNVIVLPDYLVEASLKGAARKKKKGKQAEAGLFVEGNFPIEYDGPSDLDQLWELETFRFSVGVRVQRNRVQRTRPIFRKWGVVVDVTFDPSLLNRNDVVEFFGIAGQTVGFGDWRPKYGRFSLVQVETVTQPELKAA